ncbi:MAG: V-type ATP synthase subunit F [Candidatus Altiarchaeota archaeon]|nr:V-type ATP synthase subunit F [Candidatus Altiarchaeota archaeon]
MTRLCLIGDELTTTGFGLGGVKKAYSATTETVIDVLNKVKDEADIILITNKLYDSAEERIKKIRSAGKIILKIPDRSGGGEDIIRKLIKDTVGFEIRSTKGSGDKGKGD